MSRSRLSASLTSLNVVHHPVQTSAAALLICCSYVSSYPGCGKGRAASLKGRETDHLARGERRSQLFRHNALLSASLNIQPEKKTRSYEMISVSILKSMDNKCVYFKARLSAFFAGRMTKTGSSGSYHTEHKHSGTSSSDHTMTFM